MDFKKKVLILKQTTEGFSLSDKAVSGIARFETEYGVTTFHLSLINLAVAESGNYYAVLHTPSTPLLQLDLGLRPLTFNKTLEGFAPSSPLSIALVFIREDIPTVIAYATDNNLSLPDFKKLLATKCYNDRMERLSATPTADYNDEAIANDNYYENDLTFFDKLKLIERIDDEFRNADAITNNEGAQTPRKEQESRAILQDEKLSNSIKTEKRKNFFREKKHELDALFSSNAPYPNLSSVIPESKWVKISVNDEKYYVVGLVNENGTPKYICYGVPATYSAYPPTELAGYCSFVPLSVFNLKGEGFWMIFQSADSGDCVKLNK